jgi:competence protein ComEA
VVEPEPVQPSSSARAAPPVDEQTARLDADLRAARRPRLLTVPEQLRSGRLVVSSTAVLSLLALVVALGCAFALRVLWADRSAGTELEPTPRVSTTVSVHRAAGAVAPSATGTETPSTGAAGGQVVVHVVGQVKRPGLVRLKPGARVADAITAAGGASSRADLSLLNLARLVVDGEQVLVPRPGEAPSGSGSPASAGGSAGGGGAASGGGGLVNLNTADLAALDTLPGVGPVLAQRILDWRSEHGRFTSVEELGEVSGIGEKLYAQIRPKVTV